MTAKPWGDEELALARAMCEAGDTATRTVEVLAEKGYKRSYDSVCWIRKTKGWHAKVPLSAFSLDRPALLEAERVLLLFDIHAPLHHAEWINRVVALALRMGCTACGVGGDLVDFSSISYWGRSIGIELTDEIEGCKAVLAALRANFEQVVVGGGNHERRMIRVLNGAITLQDVLGNFLGAKNVTTTNRTWFELRSGRCDFRVVHPKNYSRVPAQAASRLASKYRCSVIAGHNHLWGQTRDVSGKWWAVDAGGCADEARVGYVSDDLSTNPRWVLGAVLVLDGVPVLLGEQNIGLYEALASRKGE